MAKVQLSACLNGKQRISCRNGIFCRIADSRKPKAFGVLILIHAAIPTKRHILTVVKDRKSGFHGFFHRLLAKACFHNRFTIFGKNRYSCCCHACNIRKLLPKFSLCHGSCLEHMNSGNLRSFIFHIVCTVRAVNNRCGVRHCHYSSHTASCSCMGTGFNVFLLCLSRITKMYVKIHKTWHYHQPFSVYNLVIFILCFQLLSHFLDYAVVQINIRNFINLSSRIHNTSASNQNTHLVLSLLV